MSGEERTSRDPIPQDVALGLQLAAIAGNEPPTSLFEVRWKRPLGMAQLFVPVRELDRAATAIRDRAQHSDVYVGAAPRVRESGTGDAIVRVWCLWVDADSPQAVEQLRKFRPLPSIVVRSGTGENLHAWWQLSEPITPSHAVRANRRLALALGADRAATDAARIMRPVGSLNHKHEPPAPVECVYLELDPFTMGDVVHGLSDDPAYAPRPAPVRLRSVSRAPQALAGLARVVRESPVGERNHRLNWAAYRAGEHAADGKLDPTLAEDELLAAAVAVGLNEREALRTIASGLTAAGVAA
jgi:hypothetical protein